jgi:hypothetical protein
MRGTLRSKKFWLGAAAGVIVGPWALGKVGVSLPSFQGRIG